MIIYGINLMVPVIIDQLERCTCFLYGVKCPIGIKVVIVQLPIHFWPCPVQHPLDHSCRFFLVYPKSLEHGAHQFVVHRLGLLVEFFDGTRYSVTGIDRFCKTIEGRKFITATMVVPDLIDGPEPVLGYKLL